MSSTDEVRAWLGKKLGDGTRHMYLLSFAVSVLREQSPSEIAATLQNRLTAMCREPDKVKSDAINMTTPQVREASRSLSGYLADLLIVDLDATLHSILNALDGEAPRDGDPPFETVLGRLWPKEVRGEHAWAYRDVILLAEVRNTIVHGSGEVDLLERGGRLQAAGWDREELRKEEVLRSRSLDDVLRMKRAVRTVANEALEGRDST